MKTDKNIQFTQQIWQEKNYIVYLCCGQEVRRGGNPRQTEPGPEPPGGLIASKETARRTLKTEHNLAASIGEVCRDYAKGSRPKENGEA